MAQIAAKYTLYMLVYLGTYQPGRYPDTRYSAAERGVPRHIFGARYLVSRKCIVASTCRATGYQAWSIEVSRH